MVAVTYFSDMKWVRFSNVGPRHTLCPGELQSSTPTIVSRRQHCCRVSLRTPTSIYFIRVHEQVPTLNRFLYSTRFSGSEIITNGRVKALNTWRHCVNNRNISVEQRSLGSLQSYLQLVSILQYVNLSKCWNLAPSSSVFSRFFCLVSVISIENQIIFDYTQVPPDHKMSFFFSKRRNYKCAQCHLQQ